MSKMKATLKVLPGLLILTGHLQVHAALGSGSSLEPYNQQDIIQDAGYDVNENTVFEAFSYNEDLENLGDSRTVELLAGDQIRFNEIVENELSGERVIDISITVPEGFEERFLVPEEELAEALTASSVEGSKVAFRIEQLIGTEVAGLKWYAPVKARISSKAGMRKHPITKKRKMHYGDDYAVKIGTPVKAAANGKVTYAGKMNGYGYIVEICHPGGLSTRYAHLSKILVKKGANVKGNAVIAKSGNTGRSTGPHLHFEKRKIHKSCK